MWNKFLILSTYNLRDMLDFEFYPEDLAHLKALGSVVVEVVATAKTYKAARKKVEYYTKRRNANETLIIVKQPKRRPNAAHVS